MQRVTLCVQRLTQYVSQAPTWLTESSTDGDGTNEDGLSTGALAAIIAIR